VIQYVEKHGSISRREAAELCRLTASQAYQLLQRLEKKGFIEKTQKRGRNVRYEKKHG